MAADSIRNKLGVDTFNTLPISSDPFQEQWYLIDQRALLQIAEGGILASAYRHGKFLFNNYIPTSLTSSLDY